MKLTIIVLAFIALANKVVNGKGLTMFYTVIIKVYIFTNIQE